MMVTESCRGQFSMSTVTRSGGTGSEGSVKVNGVKFQIGSHLAGTLVTIIRDEAM